MSFWEALPVKVQKVASFITALGVIFGCVFSALGYAKSLVNDAVCAKADEIETQLHSISMDTTRLQLLSLMHTDPDNVNSILVVAHKYFVDMKGDWYMTERFKEWAAAHNIELNDFTFVD